MTRRALLPLATILFALGGATGCPPDKTPATAAARAQPPLPEPATRGKPAPPFAMEALSPKGEKLTIAAGRVTVLFFWATWHEPSKKAFPRLAKLASKYKDKGLDLIGISVDDDGQGVAEAAASWGGTFPVAWDEGHRVSERWRPTHMPSTYVVDRSGVVTDIRRGWRDLEEVELEASLLPLLGL